jgi:hypothetical protein
MPRGCTIDVFPRIVQGMTSKDVREELITMIHVREINYYNTRERAIDRDTCCISNREINNVLNQIQIGKYKIQIQL